MGLLGASTIRQQIDWLTVFIDVGQVFCSDYAKARRLCNLFTDKGLLRVNEQFNGNGHELPLFTSMGANMFATTGCVTCDGNAQEVPCFLASEPAGISTLYIK